MAGSEGFIDQYARGSGEGDNGLSRTLTLGLGILAGAALEVPTPGSPLIR
jgi:hypothetical protein